MENFNSDYDKYQKAKKQVNEIKGFYSHLTFFIIFNAIIIYVNLRYTPTELWFFWTTLSWGIGLFFHAARVFSWMPFLNKEWEERKMKQFMEEEKNKTKFE